MIKITIGAGIGALVGAVVWATLIAALKVEIGWLAWGVGLVTGLGAAIGGGRSGASGIIAATMAALAICLGKIIGVSFLMDADIKKFEQEFINVAAYMQERSTAQAFASLSQSQYPMFMVQHEYTETQDPNAIPAEDKEDFEKNVVPRLRSFEQRFPTFEKWAEDRKVAFKKFQGVVAEKYGYWPRLRDTLGVRDILFFLLGVATAFKIGTGRDAESLDSR